MKLKIFAGRSNPRLTDSVCRVADVDPGKIVLTNHNDGEIYARFKDEVRGCDVFIVQSTNQPDANLRELLIMVHAAYHASAERITAVIPYFGYARQDRKTRSREPIPAVLDPVLLKSAGVDRVLLLDLHSDVVSSGFYTLGVKTDILKAHPIFVRALSDHEITRDLSKLVIGAPDINATKLARSFALTLSGREDGLPIAVIDKRRPQAGESVVMNVVGSVDGMHVLMVDDMIDTGGTQVNAADAFLKAGAASVYALATHGVFSAKNGMTAYQRLADSCIEKVFVTDTIAGTEDGSKIVIVSVAELIGKAIKRIHGNDSISGLLDPEHWRA